MIKAGLPALIMITLWPPTNAERSLSGVWADIGASTGHGEDQALVAEDLDGAKNGISAYIVLLLELFHGRQRAVPPLASGDPGPEDGGELLVGRFRCPVINGHMIKLDHPRSELITWYICSALY